MTTHEQTITVTSHLLGRDAQIRVGSEITYRARSGKETAGVVDEVSDDIKNGEPGFGVRFEDGDERWGYADQCVRVWKF